MSYVGPDGKTYDEAGFQIDVWGKRLGPVDATVSIDQPLSAVAASQHTTVKALLGAHTIAAQNRAATTKAPVMPGAARVAVAPANKAPGLSVGWIALAIGAWWFWKKV